MASTKSPLILVGLIVAWLLASGLGFLALGLYHARPGGMGSPGDRWPSGASIPLDRARPTLVIFLHPRCPCSAASLDELEQVLASHPGRVAAHLVSFRPEGPTEGWSAPNPEISGLSIRDDPGGREASRFGVETSGHVLLFDRSGRRLFSGGITIARGHRGANPGLDRLLGAIAGVSGGSSPVFGCPVFAPDRSGRLIP